MRGGILEGGRVVLVSPYDPAAPFSIGHAMHRNKLIYALADAALVVSSDYEKGGTWAGAIEQLTKLRLVPIYVRPHTKKEKGLDALTRKGAQVWPDPNTPESFTEALETSPSPTSITPNQEELLFATHEQPTTPHAPKPSKPTTPTSSARQPHSSPTNFSPKSATS